MSTLTTSAPATPENAWRLYREQRLDLHRVAARLGCHRSQVLALVAAYKPIADARDFDRACRAGMPTIGMVDPRARDTYVKMGELLGIQAPDRRSWGTAGGTIATKLNADYFIDGETLWLWHPAARTETEQRKSATGIRILPHGEGYEMLDGWQRNVGRLSILKNAVATAGRVMRSAALTDA